MKKYDFKHCYVRVFDDTKYVETVFEDGTIVPACPHDTDEYRSNAEKYGYGDDTFALCKEHELLHTFICEKTGLDVSPTLWAVAHNFAEGTVELKHQYEEEELIMSFQSFINGKKNEPVFIQFCQNLKLEPENLAAEAKSRFRSE